MIGCFRDVVITTGMSAREGFGLPMSNSLGAAPFRGREKEELDSFSFFFQLTFSRTLGPDEPLLTHREINQSQIYQETCAL